MPRWLSSPGPSHYRPHDSSIARHRHRADFGPRAVSPMSAPVARAHNRIAVARMLRDMAPTPLAPVTRWNHSLTLGCDRDVCRSVTDLSRHADVVLASHAMLTKRFGLDGPMEITSNPLMTPLMTEAQAHVLIERNARARTMGSSYAAMVATLERRRYDDVVIL